jgi:hypothetical protein
MYIMENANLSGKPLIWRKFLCLGDLPLAQNGARYRRANKVWLPGGSSWGQIPNYR